MPKNKNPQKKAQLQADTNTTFSGPPPGTAPTTDYKQIHEDEAEALSSIYDTDFEHIKVPSAAWQQAPDIAFRLNLRASSNPEIKVQLRVSLPATYPKTLPNLALEGLEDLREGVCSRIQNVISTKPKDMLGSEMIYELAVSIQDILEDAALVQEGDKDIPSLEEERMVQETVTLQLAERKRQDELRQQEEKAAEEEKELHMLVKDRLKQKRVKEQVMRRKNKGNFEDELHSESTDDGRETVTFDPALTTRDREGRALTFRTVYGKSLISSADHKETFTVRPVVSGNAAKAPSLFLKEIFISEKDSRVTDIRQRISNSEEFLEILRRLHHQHIVEFIGFKIYRPFGPYEHHDNTWHIYTLFEFADKGSLSQLLETVGNVPVEKVRSWMIQLLDALEFFHRNGIVHGNIHCNRIFLFRTASGNTIVKLLGNVEESLPVPSTEKTRLSSSRSPLWIAPELTQEGGYASSKTDIWDLGIVLLEMGFGRDISQRYTSANEVMITMELSTPLEDMLNEMFMSDPKKRPSAFQIQPFEFFRVGAPLISSTSHPTSDQNRPRFDSQSLLPSFSRYCQDFDEAGRLGKGGFGQVVKARNKLDGRFYAIKKISRKSARFLKDTLSETMLLSRLNHPYVVRYYTAWIEEAFNDNEEAVLSSDCEDSMTSESGPGISTGGLDFISGSGYPKIEFAYDSDDANDGRVADLEESNSSPSHDDDSCATSDSQQAPSGDRSTPQSQHYGSAPQQIMTTLYIQMEYCEKHTLRDLIANDLHEDIDLTWRLFRQILDGLSHIHSHGIIHRDLKPDNIFIDVANNPRIGDFGLATSGQFTTSARPSTSTDMVGSFTQSVGTTYYVAPEMKSVSSGHYNEKVDMYSLGVIFFEMCYPLKTGMERASTLQQIRQKSHQLPSEFEQPERITQSEIIMSLLSHIPSERPTAAELLKSGKIPLQAEEEMFRKAIIDLLSNPESPDYKKILSVIFSQPSKKFEDIAWDMDTRDPPAVNQLLLEGLVKDKLIAVFRRHGALETPRKALFPRSVHYTTGVVRLLDPLGNQVQLPYDLTLPNARALSKEGSHVEKSFSFGTVYRDHLQGGEPQAHKEVDFDIISHNALDLALKEAETIKLLDEIIDEFPCLPSSQMCFHLNHCDLLELIMAFCRISPQQRPLVKQITSQLNIGPWTMQKIRSELRSPAVGVASTSIDDLSLFDFRDTPQRALSRLRGIIEGSKYADNLSPIFARLNAVTTYLKGFNVKRKVYITPLGSYNDKFYKGSILFQCLFDTKRRDVFAAGGRYDSLIKEFKSKLSGNQCHAVGFNLGWEKLCSLMSVYLLSSRKTFLKQPDADVPIQWRKRRCDVLVASFDPTVLRTLGVKIVQELWANDITAELAADASSFEELLTRHQEDSHGWTVLVKQDSLERGVKVRSIFPKEETDVRTSELSNWLLRARGREQLTESTKIGKHPVQGSPTLSRDRDPDVRILAPFHRQKKTNRRNIIGAASARSRELAERTLDGPIIAVETRDDLLNAVRSTRLSDPDSWKTFIQNAPPVERKYLEHLHRLLSDLASETHGQGENEKLTSTFIYNTHTGNCIYYDLVTNY